MESLNIVSLIFLVTLFVLIPRGALRSARLLKQVEAEGAPLPRMRIAVSTMFSLAVVGVLAAINATLLGRSLFSVDGVGATEVGYGAAAFVLLLGAIPLARRMRTPEQERRRLLNGLAPRDSTEFALFSLIALMAGFAEEAAYRGVAVWILAPVMGNMAAAMFLSAAAFAVAHAVQGGRSMALIFAIAVVFHALVYVTGTLVIAMVVHAAYDIVAGFVAGRRARELLAAPTPG